LNGDEGEEKIEEGIEWNDEDDDDEGVKLGRKREVAVALGKALGIT